jgi:hypothetical protein
MTVFEMKGNSILQAMSDPNMNVSQALILKRTPGCLEWSKVGKKIPRGMELPFWLLLHFLTN